MANIPLREALSDKTPKLMAWVCYGVPYVVEQMGEAGYDAVLIDQQHGLTSHGDLVGCLTAARAAGVPALVRPKSPDAGLIGAALDAGAQGVVVPLVETVEDTQVCVRAVKYAPKGMRSWGPYRGRLLTDHGDLEAVNDWTIACVQIETRAAMENLDDILAVDGLDMVLVGPNDLATALTGKRDIRAKEVAEACDRILKTARQHNVFAAIFANDLEFARPLFKAGWDLITVGTDMGLLENAAGDVVKALKD
ncbi:MAG: aldolase/citrate lyase family protein [Hyphomicrobiaceae bacterium]|nr:aldolase/citrate lyase family protein [Hyphomicrobiaceae bacterium]